MKRITKLLCVIITLSMVTILASSCMKRADLATYEGSAIKSGQFSLMLAIEKAQLEALYKQYYGQDISTNSSFWTSTNGDNETYADLQKENTLFLAKTMLIVDHLCKVNNLTITDESVLDEIDRTIEKIKQNAGGEDLFALALAEYGATKNDLREYLVFQEKYELLKNHLYGSSGSRRVPTEEVAEKFENEYIKINWSNFSFYAQSAGGDVSAYMHKDLTDAQISDYFKTEYVKVRFLLFPTVNTATGKELTAEEKAAAKTAAEEAFAKITNGTATYEEVAPEGQKPDESQTFTRGKMVKPFEDASYEMTVGEYRLVETEYGYHIINKLELTDKDFEAKKDDAKAKLSLIKLKEIAADYTEKLKNGEVTMKKEEEGELFQYQANVVLPRSEITSRAEYNDFYKLFEEVKVGEYGMAVIGSNGTEYGICVFQKMDLTEEDLADNYQEVEKSLIAEAFGKYLETFYESVVVNNAEYDAFDITTLISFPVDF